MNRTFKIPLFVLALSVLGCETTSKDLRTDHLVKQTGAEQITFAKRPISSTCGHGCNLSFTDLINTTIHTDGTVQSERVASISAAAWKLQWGWSPQRDALAFVVPADGSFQGSPELFLWVDGAIRRSGCLPQALGEHISWSPNGQYIAVSTASGAGALILSKETLQPVAHIEAQPTLGDLLWSQDSASLLHVTGASKTLSRFDLATKLSVVVDSYADVILDLRRARSFSDEILAIVKSGESELLHHKKAFSSTSVALGQLKRFESGREHEIAVSPDGKHVMFWGQSEQQKGLYRASRATTDVDYTPAVLHDSESSKYVEVRNLTWSPNSTMVALAARYTTNFLMQATNVINRDMFPDYDGVQLTAQLSGVALTDIKRIDWINDPANPNRQSVVGVAVGTGEFINHLYAMHFNDAVYDGWGYPERCDSTWPDGCGDSDFGLADVKDFRMSADASRILYVMGEVKTSPTKKARASGNIDLDVALQNERNQLDVSFAPVTFSPASQNAALIVGDTVKVGDPSGGSAWVDVASLLSKSDRPLTYTAGSSLALPPEAERNIELSRCEQPSETLRPIVAVLNPKGGVAQVSNNFYWPGNTATLAIDSDPASFWRVCTNGWNACVQTQVVLDLGQVCEPARIEHVLSWDIKPQYAGQAVVQFDWANSDTLNDQTQWISPQQQTLTTPGEKATLAFSGVAPSRYVRFTWVDALNSSMHWNGWGSIHEFNVYCR